MGNTHKEQMPHTVEVSTLYAPQPGHGQIFIRLPRTYGTRVPPTSNHVAAALSPFCETLQLSVHQADSAGGFIVNLSGDTDQIVQAAHNIWAHLEGTASLNGEPSVTDILPIHESVAGAVMGKNGTNLREMKSASAAHLDVSPFNGPLATRQIHITGTAEAVQYARRLVQDSIRQKLESLGETAPYEAFNNGFIQQFTPWQPAPVPYFGTGQSYPLYSDTTPAPNDSMLHSEATPENWGPQPESWGPQPVPTTNWVPSPHTPVLQASQPMLVQPLASGLEEPLQALSEQAEQLIAPGSSAALALVRQVSSRILLHLAHAQWCLLKDRIALMAGFRLAVSRFFDVRRQLNRAENSGVKLGRRTRSWAHFVLEKPNIDAELKSESELKAQKPPTLKCNTQRSSLRLMRSSSDTHLVSSQQALVPCA